MQIFLYLFFINNLFITSSLIIGSGAVIHALTGMLSHSHVHSPATFICTQVYVVLQKPGTHKVSLTSCHRTNNSCMSAVQHAELSIPLAGCQAKGTAPIWHMWLPVTGQIVCAGVPEEASSMLIPISVLVYCVAGGIKVLTSR